MIKIVDIKLAETSMILVYRNKFYEMLRQNDGDIEWFLEDLNDLSNSSQAIMTINDGL